MTHEDYVPSIRRYLLNEVQAKQLMEREYSIEDILEGRYRAEDEAFVFDILEQWNAKLGWKEFGYNVTSNELFQAAHKMIEQAVGEPVDIKFTDDHRPSDA